MTTTSTVSAGQTSTGLSVVAGETLTVSSGGTISSTTVNSGGAVTIVSGGLDSATTILAGGSETVLGSATGDHVSGTQLVSAASAVVTNETVYAGGNLDLYLKGAVATGTTVASGGALNISGNAIASNTTLSGGGVLLMESAKAVLSGGLTFAGGDNTLELSVLSSTGSSGLGDLAVISGFSSTDAIDMTSLASAAATLSVTTSGGNTVAAIISGGATVETFTFSGTTTYTSNTLSLVADAGSGVEIKYAPATPTGSTTSVTTSTASGAYSEAAGNTLLVEAGGSVSTATIASGASLILSGGSDVAAIISSGGAETISVGSAFGDQIYGLATVSGGSVAGETVQSGGQFSVASGASASATTVLAGGVEIVQGSATVDQIYGVVSTVSGGTATLTSETVLNGGQLDVLNGDTAAGATVSSGGLLFLSGNNGAVTSTVLSGGGTLEMDSPKANISGSLTFEGGGNTLDIAGVASAGYGDLAVISGFSSTDKIDVTAFGVGATLSFAASGGNEDVTVSGTGGSETFIFSGATTYTSSTLGAVSTGGQEYVEYSASGGFSSSSGSTTSVTTSTASGAYTETSGDTLLVLSGGSVSAATIDNGGSLIVNGGVDASATISAGGVETVFTGSATGDQIYGAIATSSGGAGVFANETVESGGEFTLANGNSAANTTVLSGGLFVLSGNNGAVTGAVLSGGGTLELDSPKANISGSLTFEGGGNTLGIAGVASAGYGDLAVISGFSSTDKIDVTAFGSNATLSFATSGGNEVVTVSGTGGSETLIFAGTTTYTATTLDVVTSGADEDIEYNASGWPTVTTSVTTSTASGAYTETAHDTLLVLSGGRVAAATIDNGGFLVVDGGADVAATISAGGLETISVGTATGDAIYGSAFVSGGSVSNETVLGGGALDIGAGASVNGATLSGGALDLTSPTATISGSLVFSGGGNTLEASAIPSNGSGDLAVISGFSTSDKIDVTGISPTGATLSFTSNGAGGEVATVSGTGGSESFVFSDPSQYNANTMALASDGNGGVDLVLKTTPVVAFTSLNNLQTNQATYVVDGTVDTAADPEAVGTTVSVMEGDTVVGTGVVAANGYWGADVTFTNDDGANTLTAKDTDTAGSTGVTSQSLTYNVSTTAPAFTAGNLVISLSGDSDGSDVYGDNQASPLTLEQITTSGSIVSQTVLPQTTTTNANGVTEYAISDEYGSSSEGTLELSGDGHSLVIAGYGANADAFNEGGAAVYGNSALGQSTSVEGGQYTAVPRVIADINSDGVVDTSTALYNVFNTNNPRSVATVDGSSFYISGQGVKGDDTQGLFYAQDGASSATIINDATDTRTVEIYNGQIYVSADSTQGADNISSYGDTPTSATSPTVLGGIDGTVVLNGSNGNTVNGSANGQTVNLSPENFFFANADTLYIADGGAPKAGGVGDGGLQKWVYNGTSWTLEYTLSAGLNLVNNNAGSSSNGDTGLIGLTGQVEANGTVELYATTEPLNDLGTTSVVAITDTLTSTTGAGEGFTTVVTASSGENIRGIAFAPTPYTPTIAGTVAGQTSDFGTPVTLFSGGTIADQNANAVDTLTITIGGNGGVLSDGAGFNGLTGGSGVYTLSGTAAAITSELDALTFTPSSSATGASTFTLSDVSSADPTPTVDATTTVDVAAPTGALSQTAAFVSQHIDALNADAGLTSITLTDSGTPTLTLTATQALDDTTALNKITNASYAIALSDTAANVSANLDALNADRNVTSITLTDSGTPTLTITQNQAIDDASALAKIAEPYTLDITDPGVYDASAFTAAEVSVSINANGTPVLVTPDGTEDLTGVTTIDLADATITASGDTLTRANADGSTLVSTFDIAGQIYTSRAIAYGSDGELQSKTYEGVTGNGNLSSFEYLYAGGNQVGSDFFYTGIAGQPYTGEEVDYDGAGDLTRVALTGVTGTGYSAYENDYVGGVLEGSQFSVTTVPQGASYSSYQLDYDAAGDFTGDKFFFTGITGQTYTAEEEDFDASGQLAKVFISGVAGQAYSSLEEDFSAGVYTGYKAFYAAPGGADYTTEEVDVNASNQIQKAVYSGMSGTPYSTVEVDYSNGAATDAIYGFTNVTGANYNAYQVEENASGGLMQTTYDLNNGNHAIVGAQAGLTINSIGDDNITGGGSGETFAFNGVYGHDTITDFSSYATGAGNDTISLSTSEFANFNAVMSAATNSGSNAVIAAADGDTLTLKNMNVATLSTLGSDFTFHG